MKIGHQDRVPDHAAGSRVAPLDRGWSRRPQPSYAERPLADDTFEPEGAVGYTRSVTRPGAPVRGWFITIEGPEGAGKTTQAAALGTHLIDRGLDVHITREPGGTWLGERLREVLLARTDGAAPTDPLTDALLFNAARRQLVTEVIEPALAAGRSILCARFADSTVAYQGYGAGVELETLRSLEAAATDGLKPDLTILLDLAPEEGLSRVAPGDVTRFEAEFDLAFHRRVRAGFLALAAAEPERFAIVDASRPTDVVARDVAVAAERLVAQIEPKPAGARTTG
jgi:dTMP kinase